MKLCLAQANPFVCNYFINETHSIDKYYFADGSILYKPSNEY